MNQWLYWTLPLAALLVGAAFGWVVGVSAAFVAGWLEDRR